MMTSVETPAWPPTCPHCGGSAGWVKAESVGPVHLAYTGSDLVEVIPERVCYAVEPCRHKVYRDDAGGWVLAECFESEIGRHAWRDDRRLIVPVEEYCGNCGEWRPIEHTASRSTLA